MLCSIHAEAQVCLVSVPANLLWWADCLLRSGDECMSLLLWGGIALKCNGLGSGASSESLLVVFVSQ